MTGPATPSVRPGHRALRALRRRWWAVLLAVLLGAAVGALVAANEQPVYAGHVTFFVSNSVERAQPDLSGDQLAQQRTLSLAHLVGSTRLAGRVVADRGLHVSARHVADATSATVRSGTVLMDVTARDSSQTRALAIVTGVARELPALVTSLDADKDPYGHPVATYLTVVNGPGVTARPVSPDRVRVSVLGGVLGLLVAAAALAVGELRDRRIRTGEQLERRSGAWFLGQLSFVPDAAATPGGALAEEIRQLRTAVQFLDVRVVLVCGVVPGVGASAAAQWLAAAVADNGRRVCLVGADLRHRTSVPQPPGLADLLLRRVPAGNVVTSGADGVDQLPGGTPPPNPADLLDTAATAAVIARLRTGYDLVVIEAPAVLPFADAPILSRYADATVLVARFGRTTEAMVERAARAVSAAGGRVRGAVLAMAPEPSGDATYTAYYRSAPDVAAPDDDTDGAAEGRATAAEPLDAFRA